MIPEIFFFLLFIYFYQTLNVISGDIYADIDTRAIISANQFISQAKRTANDCVRLQAKHDGKMAYLSIANVLGDTLSWMCKEKL